MSRLFHKKERHEEEPATENQIEGDVVEVAGEESSSTQFRTLQHIGSYPLVQQTKHVLHRLPPARIVVANTKPVVVSFVNSKPVTLVRPVTNIADRILDKTLTITEKIVPSLKTKTYQRLGEEIMLPYTITKTVVNKTATGTVNVAHTYFYEPTHEQILKFRRFYNEKIIDTHGKPIIRGSLDFVVGPANKQYEKVITKVLPEGKQVSATGFSNEVDRSFALTLNAISRLVPAAARKTSKVVWAPCNYVKHVNDVFNQNLDKQENLQWANSWKAAKEAVKELNSETIGHVKHLVPLGGGLLSSKKEPAAEAELRASRDDDSKRNRTDEEKLRSRQDEEKQQRSRQEDDKQHQ